MVDSGILADITTCVSDLASLLGVSATYTVYGAGEEAEPATVAVVVTRREETDMMEQISAQWDAHEAIILIPVASVATVARMDTIATASETWTVRKAWKDVAGVYWKAHCTSDERRIF